MLGNGIAFIPTAPEKLRNADTHYPYRFDSHFWYLTGFPEPEAMLVLVGGKSPRTILFCREKNLEREIWDGYRYGPEAAQSVFNVDEAYAIDDLEKMAPSLIAGHEDVFYPIGLYPELDKRVIDWLDQLKRQVRSGVRAPSTLKDIRALIDDMRLIKDRAEIRTMKNAAEIAAQGHIRAMLTTEPGRYEYEIEAELTHEFRRQGAQAHAYSPIVASGANACVLHYVENNAMIDEGALLLIDAGCELDGYAADITRSFPANGRFSPAQRDCYEWVLSAQEAALKALKPGATFTAYHDAAVRVLAQAMISLKLLKGPVDRVIESGEYRRFYMHRTGHWLGLDVHDVGSYTVLDKPRRLEAGQVLTVEPGLYIRPDRQVPRSLWNIGIRIEDDVLITETGHEILTSSVPKEVDEIETLMANRAL
jgi:Xaa-Pro aminopeptidase